MSDIQIEYTIEVYSPFDDRTEHIYDSYLDLSDIDELENNSGYWKVYDEALNVFSKICTKINNTAYSKVTLIKEKYHVFDDSNENYDAKLLSSEIIETMNRDIGPIYQVRCTICEELYDWYCNVPWMMNEFLKGWIENTPNCTGIKVNKCSCGQCKWSCSDCSYTDDDDYDDYDNDNNDSDNDDYDNNDYDYDDDNDDYDNGDEEYYESVYHFLENSTDTESEQCSTKIVDITPKQNSSHNEEPDSEENPEKVPLLDDCC